MCLPTDFHTTCQGTKMYGLSHFYVGGMIGRSWKGQNCQMGTLTSVSSQIKYIGHYSYTDLSQVQLPKRVSMPKLVAI